MVTQRSWRIAGLLFLGLALGMLIYPGPIIRLDASLLYVCLYWALFTFFILAALYVAMLDIRFIRLQYKMKERELFRDTFFKGK